MKKLIFTLALLSPTSDLYAETTVPAHTTATVQSIKIYSDTVPQDMSQTQYQALLLQKPAMSKQIAANATREFRNKITYAWQPPVDSKGESAIANIILTEAGMVTSIWVQSSNPEVKTSVERAIRAAAPFPMPNDPEARRLARSFKVVLTVK